MGNPRKSERKLAKERDKGARNLSRTHDQLPPHFWHSRKDEFIEFDRDNVQLMHRDVEELYKVGEALPRALEHYAMRAPKEDELRFLLKHLSHISREIEYSSLRVATQEELKQIRALDRDEESGINEDSKPEDFSIDYEKIMKLCIRMITIAALALRCKFIDDHPHKSKTFKQYFNVALRRIEAIQPALVELYEQMKDRPDPLMEDNDAVRQNKIRMRVQEKCPQLVWLNPRDLQDLVASPDFSEVRILVINVCKEPSKKRYDIAYANYRHPVSSNDRNFESMKNEPTRFYRSVPIQKSTTKQDYKAFSENASHCIVKYRDFMAEQQRVNTARLSLDNIMTATVPLDFIHAQHMPLGLIQGHPTVLSIKQHPLIQSIINQVDLPVGTKSFLRQYRDNIYDLVVIADIDSKQPKTCNGFPVHMQNTKSLSETEKLHLELPNNQGDPLWLMYHALTTFFPQYHAWCEEYETWKKENYTRKKIAIKPPKVLLLDGGLWGLNQLSEKLVEEDETPKFDSSTSSDQSHLKKQEENPFEKYRDTAIHSGYDLPPISAFCYNPAAIISDFMDLFMLTPSFDKNVCDYLGIGVKESGAQSDQDRYTRWSEAKLHIPEEVKTKEFMDDHKEEQEMKQQKVMPDFGRSKLDYYQTNVSYPQTSDLSNQMISLAVNAKNFYTSQQLTNLHSEKAPLSIPPTYDRGNKPFYHTSCTHQTLAPNVNQQPHATFEAHKLFPHSSVQLQLNIAPDLPNRATKPKSAEYQDVINDIEPVPKQRWLKRINIQISIPPKHARINAQLVDDNEIRRERDFLRSCSEKLYKNFLKLSSHETQTVGATGLVNDRNFCFVNASIQLLSSVRSLVELFLWRRDGDTAILFFVNMLSSPLHMQNQGRLVSAMRAFFTFLYVECRATANATSVVSYLDSKSGTSFNDRRQHDAQEFITTLLDALHEEMNVIGRFDEPVQKQRKMVNQQIHEVVTHLEQKFVHNNSKHEQEDLLRMLADAQTLRWQWAGQSLIYDLFRGMYVQTIRCDTCHYESYSFDTFMQLTLDLPPDLDDDHPISLDQTFKEHFRAEQLPLHQRHWKCERCKCERNAHKYYAIWHVPRVLLIHIKRFQDRFHKRRTPVECPREIQHIIKMYTHVIADNVPYLEQNKYQLKAAINHRGTLERGHYTATAARPMLDGIERCRFYDFNDHIVSTHTETPLVNPTEVYMLVYESDNATINHREIINRGLQEHVLHH